MVVRLVIMKIIILLSYTLLATVLCQTRYYDRRYDYFDIDALVENPRLLRKYIECFLDKGPCTPVGRVFKFALPEVIATGCGRCTPAQRSFARRTFDAFKKQLPEEHAQLKKNLDPQNMFYDRFEKIIANA